MEEENDTTVEPEDETKEGEEEEEGSNEARIKELEAEAAKWKRIAQKKNKERNNSESKEEPDDSGDINKSSELNEGQLALLTVKGIDHDDDIEFIQNEMTATGKSLAQVLNMRYVQETLKDNKDARDVRQATPKGNRRSQTQAQDTVEYHIAKGTRPLEIQDVNVRRQVVNKRIEVEKNASKFSDSPLIQ